MSTEKIPPYKDVEIPIDERVEDLLSRMDLKEKIAQMGSHFANMMIESRKLSFEKAKKLLKSGIGEITRLGSGIDLSPLETAKTANAIQKFLTEETRLGIPAIIHDECLAGYVAKEATVFPQMIGLGSTWEPELAKDMTTIIRHQMREVGIQHALSPVLDVVRDPRWGRTEECFGEDPYLVTSMGVEYTKGLQGKSLKTGVMACGKHFTGYGAPMGGRNWGPGQLGMRDLLENYTRPFEAAIRLANLSTVMNAYHEIDGLPCGFSKFFLTDLLRDKLGFTGFVVSDYFTLNLASIMHQIAPSPAKAGILALKAGMDMELPKVNGFSGQFRSYVKKGKINESYVDQAVRRILTKKFELGLFENPYVSEEKKDIMKSYSNPKNKELSKEIALKSIVLLKNEESILPLSKKIGTLAVIGPSSDSPRNLLGDYSFVSHFESTAINVTGNREYDKETMEYMQNEMDPNDFDMYPRKLYGMESILDVIKRTVSPNTEVLHAKGCKLYGDDKSEFKNAIEIARKSDIVIFVGGERSGLMDNSSSGESLDRIDICLPGVQEELLKEIHAIGTPIVFVMLNGRPLTIKWEKENVPAILEAWLPGELGAEAITEVLFGDYNPGGKLPITFPQAVGQIPIYHNIKPTGLTSVWTFNYVEMSCAALFPFGYGLSYTNFDYSNLQITPKDVDINSKVTISVDVINSGDRKGDEVVQLYLRDEEAGLTRPIEELFGFKRIALEPNEMKRVTFTVPMNLLGFYNEDMKFLVEPGRISVFFGSIHALHGSEKLQVNDYFAPTDVKISGFFNIVGKIKRIEKKSFFSEVRVKKI